MTAELKRCGRTAWPSGEPAVLPPGRLPVDFESRKTVSAGPYIAHHQAKMELAHSPGGLGCGSDGEPTKLGAAKVTATSPY